MRFLIKPVFWTLLFCAAFLALDQFLVQFPPLHPSHQAVSVFYVDFRSRLGDMVLGEKKPLKEKGKIKKVTPQKGGAIKKDAAPKSIEDVIQKQTPATTSAAKAVEEVAAKLRYIYTDEAGVLQFVDALEDVPEKFRTQAQPVGQ
ncbi:MAG: hypothetical protein OET90_08090 [Desulfuromonadales bacterium]|nr:hypothetical protein [Desulfuromonadales bacterium]